MTPATPNRIRFALAAQAYTSGTVRLATRDLGNCSHLVATRRGLFAVSQNDQRLIAHGLFFGIAVLDDLIFLFEACDSPVSPTQRGRLVRLRRAGAEIVAVDVLATGLDNGCHQIDLVDGRIHVVDTYNQSILRYAPGGGDPDVLRPIRGASASLWDQGYVHINSLLSVGGEILLMLHNGADKTNRPSEIARFTRDWRLIERRPVAGLGCHNLALLENGAILSCGSFAGELISSEGRKVPVCDMMTRGLSLDDERIVVGGSAFGDRASREVANSMVFFLDRDFKRLSCLAMPGPTMEIRRIDGRDRSLSPHVAASRVDWGIGAAETGASR